LDLHTDAFFAARSAEMHARLNEISNGGAEARIAAVYAAHHERRTCVVGLDWSYAVSDLREIARCFDGEALATLCKVLAQEYGQRGGGVPDLFLWRVGDEGDDVDGGAEGAKGDGGGDATTSAAKGDKGTAAAAAAAGDSKSGQGDARRRGGEVKFAEVKSENDRLSDTQRLWIHVLCGAGVRVELCAAVASEVVVE
jgi:Fanconi-associated nuclease 1